MKRRKEQPEITLDTVVQRDPDQEFSMIDDEVVMLSLKNGEYYSLNYVASSIWSIINSPIYVKDILNNLLTQFEVDYETCKTQTIHCLVDFYSRSLLLIHD